MHTCPDCGCRVYALGCVNCHEADYIERDFAEEIMELGEREAEEREAEADATREG